MTTIKAYLFEIGVPESYFNQVGEIKPVLSNIDEDGRAFNRRSQYIYFEIQKYRLLK